jgi:hypothetical protein
MWPERKRAHFTGGDYFQTMGIRVLKGSCVVQNANLTSDVRVIVSAAAARLLWRGEDPIRLGAEPIAALRAG